MPDTVPTPNRMIELPPQTRDWLAGLRPDEVETLQAIVEMPADDVRDGFKMVRDLRAVGRFSRWLIITTVAIFIGTVALYENFLKLLKYAKGG